MKAMIGYGVFQKPDMFPWYLSGIQENFPPETMTHFYLEAMRNEDLEALEASAEPNRKDWPVFLCGWGRGHILEHGVHRHLIEHFMATDCDVLIIPQDDNRFQRPLLPDLQALWEQYGETLGWISGRDGHGFGYSDMCCSPFSDSTGANKEILPIGTHREVMMMNTGPVVYFRHVIEKGCIPDPDLAWYWWSSMSLQCHSKGLKNILLSMACLHEKFGRIGNNPGLFNAELVADCLKRFNDRWRPVYGRNPL